MRAKPFYRKEFSPDRGSNRRIGRGVYRRGVPSKVGSEPQRLRRALEDTIRALRQAERLGPADALLVAMLRTCADRADSRREDSRQYLRLLAHLEARLQGLGAPVDDEWAQLLASATGPEQPTLR